MIVADTSVWISYFRKDDPGLIHILKKYLSKDDVYAVSAIFGELLQGAKNKREVDIINLVWESMPRADEYQLFLRAGELSQKFKLHSKGVGLIDCYILAVCLENGFVLWSLDKNLQNTFDELHGQY